MVIPPVKSQTGSWRMVEGNEQAVGVVIHILEQRQQFFVAPVFDRRIRRQTIIHGSQSAQENGDRHGAFAVEFQDEVIVLAGLKLHPGAAVGDQLGHRQRPPGSSGPPGFKIHAWRTDQLRNNHPFGAVNDESALFGHLGEVAQENFLANWLRDFRPASSTETYSGLA